MRPMSRARTPLPPSASSGRDPRGAARRTSATRIPPSTGRPCPRSAPNPGVGRAHPLRVRRECRRATLRGRKVSKGPTTDQRSPEPVAHHGRRDPRPRSPRGAPGKNRPRAAPRPAGDCTRSPRSPCPGAPASCRRRPGAHGATVDHGPGREGAAGASSITGSGWAGCPDARRGRRPRRLRRSAAKREAPMAEEALASTASAGRIARPIWANRSRFTARPRGRIPSRGRRPRAHRRVAVRRVRARARYFGVPRRTGILLGGGWGGGGWMGWLGGGVGGVGDGGGAARS